MQISRKICTLNRLILLLSLGWCMQAQAFFCLTPEKNRQNNAPFRQASFYPPPPFFAPPPMPFNRQMTPAEAPRLPSTSPGKAAPEVIDGYRFRPTGNKTWTEETLKRVISTQR
jgi:hypothetical protein